MASVGMAWFNDPTKNTLPELPKSLSATTTADALDKRTPGSAAPPRSASYTYLPSVAGSRSHSTSIASLEDAPTITKPSRSRQSRDDGRIRISNFTPAKEVVSPDTSYNGKANKSPVKSPRRPGRTPRTVSDSLANLARKSWATSSRSPSPKRRHGEHNTRPDKLPTSVSSGSLPSLQELHLPPDDNGAARPNHLLRNMSIRGSGLLKKSKKSQTFRPNPSETNGDTNGTPTPSLPRSVSCDRISSMARSTISEKPPQLPPIPTSSSSDKLNGSSMDAFRKKDELWSVFRSLEHDFSKFQSKSSALKANVVRSALMPFLITYADHPSTKNLRPEDLDRRVGILNRWWTGLLELLDGNKSSLSGTDRPVLLDGIIGLMTREEWRLSPSPFASLAEQQARLGLDKIKRSQSSNSLSSTASDFIAESIHHNVRNTFVQNLLSQTAIIVDKMSNKTAPASLVVFGGKALAYAFFFCPGLADIFLHLWATPLDSIRRVSREFGLSEGPKQRELSERVSSTFPPCLQSLGFRSFASTVKWLRKRPLMPPGASRINWHGPWTGRWIGRDSDLFFGFVKQWHILLAEFLPADMLLKEKASCPAFVLVHAQILTILDTTVHRQHNQAQDAAAAATTTATSFDDVLGDANATVAALPLPATNVSRLMAENRLIMLLRDVLSKRSLVSKVARHTFAEAFVHVLQAATRSISVFDHSACFTLCDFLEESATILIRYQSVTPLSERMIDWGFWLDVCKKMSKSQNTMSELRLLALLYSIWGILTADERRKEGLVLGWLISEETFGAYFDHWCPIIRAYYMRLLCWRVARCEEEASEVDIRILEALSTRLASAWQSFLQASAVAEMRQVLGPSTAPCSPAPGRRLLIIRNDTFVDHSLRSTFEGLIQITGTARRSNRDRRTSQNGLADAMPGSSLGRKVSIVQPSESGGWKGEDPPKKKWGLLRNIKSLNVSANKGRDGSTSPPQTGSGEDSPEHGQGSGSATPEAKLELQHSFRFSLEWMERPHKPSKERILYPPRLPNLAYTILESKRPTSSEGDDAAEEQPPVPSKSTTATLRPGGSKYIGRALAEWALIVLECQNFFERRMIEGVKSTASVETPVLGMDAFRKHGQ